MHVCQVIEVVVTVFKSATQRSRCPPLTANALLYMAELCTTVKLHVIPLLPLLMPAVIDVTTDLSLLTRSVFVTFISALWFLQGVSIACCASLVLAVVGMSVCPSITLALSENDAS